MNPITEISCNRTGNHFSAYLDGALTGVEMQAVARHLEGCPACSANFDGWRALQHNLSDLGPARPPADLALRLRVALSREQARSPRNSLAQWRLRWDNTLAPFMLRASAGFAGAVLLVGAMTLLIGTFATPETLAARDEPIGMASTPHLLYSSYPVGAADGADLKLLDNPSVPTVVEAYINGAGRVYDFRIISGSIDQQTYETLQNKLLFSLFEPARVFGQPVRGVAILSFSGVSVQG
jgi:hypothetical protein